MNWKDYWNTFPNQFKKNEFVKQVGKTVQGQPISDEQLDDLILEVIQKLNLNIDDSVLDLCCGNGLITSGIAEKCHSIVGVDFSKPLIEIAQEYNSRSNTRYYNLSVLDINPENIHTFNPFTKIYMYEALQYFQEDQLSHLIEILLVLSSERTIMLFTSVPDKSKIWEFYNTPERKRDYEMRKSSGTEAIGTWWDTSFILQTCGHYGLHCEFLPQPENSHTAHYRFDVRIKKK